MDSLSPSSDGPRCWSKLHTDLLHMIFERLGFADFQRANSVCSSWRSASRQSAPTNQIPWLILFPEKGEDYCLLFNPEEKDRMYRIQDLDVNFANSHCLAISGSWLFIRDPRYNFYILNLFTRERIDMPPVESQLGMLKIERTTNDMFLVKLTDEDDRRARDLNFHWPLFWIDEQTRDYVVTGLIDSDFGSILIYSKNGDSFWKQIKRTEPYDLLLDMVCRDHKIYLYNWSRNVKVLDLSGGSPRQIFETHGNYVYLCNYSFIPYLDDEEWPIKKTHLVVTVTGEFLRVKSIVMSNSDVWTFRVYKMDSSNREWEKITSLGDEAILLDQGITVLANAIEGLNRNSIYFNGDRDESGIRVWSEKDVFIFNLDTNEVERPHRSICSSIQSPDARWFVPNINQK